MSERPNDALVNLRDRSKPDVQRDATMVWRVTEQCQNHASQPFGIAWPEVVILERLVRCEEAGGNHHCMQFVGVDVELWIGGSLDR